MTSDCLLKSDGYDLQKAFSNQLTRDFPFREKCTQKTCIVLFLEIQGKKSFSLLVI